MTSAAPAIAIHHPTAPTPRGGGPGIIRGMTRQLRPLIAVIVLAVARMTVHAADTHQFVPDRFYNTWSAAHPPALHVKPGDRVVTKTIDAGGVDWNGKSVAQGPNPETGPFYIDGAEPGDMLVVTIVRVACRSRAEAGDVDDRQGQRCRAAGSDSRQRDSTRRYRVAFEADARLH